MSLRNYIASLFVFPFFKSQIAYAENVKCVSSYDFKEEFLTSVLKTSSKSWYVERKMVEFYANNPLKLRRLAGTWTHKIDGEKVGFKIKPTKCSPLFEAGFETNDIITTVNNVKVATLFDAIKAYFKLKGESVFTVNMLRDKKQMTQVYVLDKSKSTVRKKTVQKR